tara:strand:+ start:122 stop:589 length:468 start_codon:yes stop_codon:yes gene_type:complete
MIITCPCGEKRFEVNENLIPEKGRLLKCGSCEQTWFFDKKQQNQLKSNIFEDKKKEIKIKEKKVSNKKEKIPNQLVDKNENKKDYEIIKYQNKSNFTFTKFLSYIIVFILSFIATIIIIDTFKVPLYKKFPELELLIYSLFEILKDITLFVKDLI